MAVCLEVCPETYEPQGTIRLHIHMFLKRTYEKLRLRHAAGLRSDGCAPHVSSSIGGGVGKGEK